MLRTLRFDDDVAPGTELLYEGAAAGRVRSSVASPRFGPLGIGMVRAAVPQGAELAAGGATAVVGPLPEGTKVKTPD